jgi:hypothetical protein
LVAHNRPSASFFTAASVVQASQRRRIQPASRAQVAFDNEEG